MKISTTEIIECCEQAKKARLARQKDAYKDHARLCLDELRAQGFLPDDTQVIKIMSGGRVNYFTAKLCIDEKIIFAKMSAGGLESRVLKHMQLENIVISGSSFSAPKCMKIIEVGPAFLYFFEHFEGLETTPGVEQDEIRLRGLSEFNVRNTAYPDDTRLSGIPKHRNYMRPESVDKLIRLGLDDDIISNQKRILSKWGAVLPLLKKAPLCICIRDSGRKNVCLSDGKAALIDFGATHYAPLGFDMWSYLMKSPNMIERALEIADAHYARHELKGVSAESIAISGTSAAGIMGLDTFLGISNYASAKRIGELQKMILDLLESV
jgi:hypothetical protein